VLCCAVQRLCEELEYSELLDRVVEINDPFERMVKSFICAFHRLISDISPEYFRAVSIRGIFSVLLQRECQRRPEFVIGVFSVGSVCPERYLCIL